MGSTIVQMSESVGSALKMSIQALFGSGITSMSDALVTFQPRMLGPSKPSTSVKRSSLYSVSVVVECCQVPGRSVNLKSTSFTPWSLMILLTSDGVLSLAICFVEGLNSLQSYKGYIVKSLNHQTAKPLERRNGSTIQRTARQR